MAHFDADAYRAAREPFTLAVAGRTYAARPVSAELVVRLERDLGASDGRVARRALRRLLRAAFPWRVAWLWLGDPVDRALQLDLDARRELLTRFFRFLGGRSAVPPATPGTP